MNLEIIETAVHWIGGVVAYITLGAILFGIWRGTQREAGVSIGRNVAWLRSPWFYLVTSAIFFGVCFVAWIPLPLVIPPSTRIWMLALGSLVYFPGMASVLWARLALGKDYFVSTGLGAQLFAGHRLVTGGPFAILRHPMYAGIFLAAFGSLLIYHTWTTLLFSCFSPFLYFRALREEAALARMFGDQWREYCQRVPMLTPRFLMRRKNP